MSKKYILIFFLLITISVGITMLKASPTKFASNNTLPKTAIRGNSQMSNEAINRKENGAYKFRNFSITLNPQFLVTEYKYTYSLEREEATFKGPTSEFRIFSDAHDPYVVMGLPNLQYTPSRIQGLDGFRASEESLDVNVGTLSNNMFMFVKNNVGYLIASTEAQNSQNKSSIEEILGALVFNENNNLNYYYDEQITVTQPGKLTIFEFNDFSIKLPETLFFTSYYSHDWLGKQIKTFAIDGVQKISKDGEYHVDVNIVPSGEFYNGINYTSWPQTNRGSNQIYKTEASEMGRDGPPIYMTQAVIIPSKGDIYFYIQSWANSPVVSDLQTQIINGIEIK